MESIERMPVCRRRMDHLRRQWLAVGLQAATTMTRAAGRRRSRAIIAWVASLGVLAMPILATAEEGVPEWAEEHRSFVQDGPGFLLTRDEREAVLAMSEEERSEFIEQFLADPIPETAENELREGIRRRTALVLSEGFVSWTDDRAKILFLLGRPAERVPVDCGQVFVPLEVWKYSLEVASFSLVFYKANRELPYALWLPFNSKRALYNDDMEYILDQIAEFGMRRRIDAKVCPLAREVDAATGIEGLHRFQKERPTNEQLIAYLRRPENLARWAERAAQTPLTEAPEELPVLDFAIVYPDQIRQRLVTRFLLTVPAEVELGTVMEGEREELRISIDGVVEQGGKLFDEFRVRFKHAPPEEGLGLALAFERLLRPGREFVVRFRVTDEITGKELVLNRAFRVPDEPEEMEELPVPDDVVVAMGEEMKIRGFAGEDGLLLAPPGESVVLGVWRADALVTGDRIEKVVFLVDGEVQMTKGNPPFSAELRLAQYPREQLIRAEGYDTTNQLVAADEVVINQPRGAFKVRIVEPRAGAAISGRVSASAEVTVPDERYVTRVEFRLNEESLATLEQPPWEVDLDVPAGGTAYLTVRATLDDQTAAEEVRFINAPEHLEEVEVQLVELLTTVTDSSRKLVADLKASDFQVLEGGRRQEIIKFEHVSNVPLSVGITIDTSGSMMESLIEAKEAALGFLRSVIGPQDKVFAVAFAREPALLIPATDDVGAVEGALEDLQSIGWTALHDAVVSSLYYFRALKGQRALILLSDGDDSASYYPFRDALEYARRSGVVIYTVGLNVGSLKVGIRRKLTTLAEETGGRVFFISDASELSGVYRQIETELRSQYLLAYSSDNPSKADTFRAIEVKVEGNHKARTIAGYYP